MLNPSVIYFVKKETYTYRLCSKCSGIGRTTRKKGRYKFEEDCIVCSGSGKIKLTHQTEIPLLQALRELNLIK